MSRTLCEVKGCTSTGKVLLEFPMQEYLLLCNYHTEEAIEVALAFNLMLPITKHSRLDPRMTEEYLGEKWDGSNRKYIL